jgi:hypothetical protein
MQRLRASWQVFAGVIPGQPLDDLTKSWYYTEDDYEKDKAMPKDTEEISIFQTYMKEASDYALSITHPAYVNWIKNEFIWL